MLTLIHEPWNANVTVSSLGSHLNTVQNLKKGSYSQLKFFSKVFNCLFDCLRRSKHKIMDYCQASNFLILQTSCFYHIPLWINLWNIYHLVYRFVFIWFVHFKAPTFAFTIKAKESFRHTLTRGLPRFCCTVHVFIPVFPTVLPLYVCFLFLDYLFKVCLFILSFYYLQLFQPKQVLHILLHSRIEPILVLD